MRVPFVIFSLFFSPLGFAKPESKPLGPMGLSKGDIQIILSAFQDQEGAIIKKILRLDNGKYEVDLVTKKKQCHRNVIKVDRTKKRALFDKKVQRCD